MNNKFKSFAILFVLVVVGFMIIHATLPRLSNTPPPQSTGSSVVASSSLSCKFEEITPEQVKKLSGDDNFDDKIVKELNDRTPYCKDLCLEELGNSQKYPNEWWTTDDNIQLCKKAGIELPAKYQK